MEEKRKNPPKSKHEGSERSSPYPISRLAPSFELVDLASEIAQADRMVGNVAGGKLEIIARQIRALQKEAQELLVRTRENLDLHRADCHFPKRIGQIYHLYRKESGVLYWSMLSPDDWGTAAPHDFEGSYRLEADQSWTPKAQIEESAESPEALVQRLLQSELTFSE